MILTRNCPEDEQIKRFLRFCECKFEWKYPVRIDFCSVWTKHSARGLYHQLGKYISINANQNNRHSLLLTIAHEVRHAQQHMHSLRTWRRNSEKDANTVARQWVEEFGETTFNLQENMGD